MPPLLLHESYFDMLLCTLGFTSTSAFPLKGKGDLVDGEERSTHN
jgi:hypothetical protein